MPKSRVQSTRHSRRRVGERILELAPPLRKLIHEVLSDGDLNLSYRQYRVLLRIREGHTSLTRLAELAITSLPSMSGSVEGLVQRGLIQRFANRTDRRSARLALTKKGETSLRAASKRLDRLTSALARALERASDLTAGALEKFEHTLTGVLEEVRRRRRDSEKADRA